MIDGPPSHSAIKVRWGPGLEVRDLPRSQLPTDILTLTRSRNGCWAPSPHWCAPYNTHWSELKRVCPAHTGGITCRIW
jgi:hypothetical protein